MCLCVCTCLGSGVLRQARRRYHNPQPLDLCAQIHQVLLTTEPHVYVCKAAKHFVFAFGEGSTKTEPT